MAPCRLILLLLFTALTCHAAAPPEDFPRFQIPGQEKEMDALRRLFWLHYEPAGPLIPLWDEWMPMSTLWPARSDAALNAMRVRWATALANRPMNAEGYIHTQQHDGPAHAEGWPFPSWMSAGGIGWHFRSTGVPGYEAPLTTPEKWIVTGADGTNVNEKGWVLKLIQAGAMAQPPAFSIAARQSPWLRLNWWAAGLDAANCFVEWTTQEQPQFSPERRVYFPPAESKGASEPNTSVQETRTMIPLYRVPGWTGTITGLRVRFANSSPASVVIKSIHTASDTRHTINNTGFVRGSTHYFMWTRDIGFLRAQIGRLRGAIRYMMNEFDTRRRKCVYTTWPGHEGRSGVRVAEGKKTVVPGEGIGGNYWDLLPFGGEDSLATIYYYDALLDLAEIEQAICRHPQWSVAVGAEAFDPADLRRHAAEVRDYGAGRFWNPKTGRFGTVDLEGKLNDFGFTFLNNEAIYYGFAKPDQAEAIRAWISGQRIVEGDTSTGADIYHWRFGPRATTRRNIEYYFWGWSSPESIPWGYQVQDGGAVLGFSYHDLMSRLQVHGPDDAWQRLKEILTWFDETQAAGGYREYYKDRSRGTMQGGNVAGGLGLDREFFESILVPQVMIYGFLGLRPTAEGLSLSPRLPQAWPEVKLTRIHLHDQVLDLTVKGKSVSLESHRSSDEPLALRLPCGWTATNRSPEKLTFTIQND